MASCVAFCTYGDSAWPGAIPLCVLAPVAFTAIACNVPFAGIALSAGLSFASGVFTGTVFASVMKFLFDEASLSGLLWT